MRGERSRKARVCFARNCRHLAGGLFRFLTARDSCRHPQPSLTIKPLKGCLHDMSPLSMDRAGIFFFFLEQPQEGGKTGRLIISFLVRWRQPSALRDKVSLFSSSSSSSVPFCLHLN